VNEVYPTLHTKITTLQTAGSSCAQKSYDVLTPYLLSCIEALMIIIRETRAMFFKRWISKEQCTIVLSSLFKDFVLVMSSDVGGCPILNVLAFLYRGHPDPLTTYTTGLYLIRDKDMEKRMYSWLMCRLYRLGQGKAELLISNPCALNIDLPYNLSSKIRKELEDVLIRLTRNVHLKEIFNDASKCQDEAFFNYLISSEPCHPRVLHEIFRNSITGAKLTIISKFSYHTGIVRIKPIS
jgi:hypothetical protein